MDTGKTPYVVAIVTQLIFTGSFVISKAAYDEGLDIVFVFYHQAFGSALLLPLAFLLQRLTSNGDISNGDISNRQLSSCGHLLHGSAVEDGKREAKEHFSGIAKLTGVALSLAGVLVIAFYAGPALSPVNHHRAFTSHASRSGANVITRVALTKYTFLMVIASMAFALWILMLVTSDPERVSKQAAYNDCAVRVITTVQSVFTMLQSIVAAVFFQRDFSRWKLRFNVSLLAVLYSGFVVMGGNTYLQIWCVELKGPVFLSVWTPLCFVFTILCSSFFLREVVHLGSIIGATLLVGGLYSVLWGKTKENKLDDGEKHEEHQQQKPPEKKKNSYEEEQEQRC
ncbi:hypothetical protein EJB05_50806, partial [Eragrostis curvula]